MKVKRGYYIRSAYGTKVLKTESGATLTLANAMHARCQQLNSKGNTLKHTSN